MRPLRAGEDPAAPSEVDGIPVVAVLRSRGDGRGAMLALADGRYAVTGETWSRSAAAGPWPTGASGGPSAPASTRPSAPGGRRSPGR